MSSTDDDHSNDNDQQTSDGAEFRTMELQNLQEDYEELRSKEWKLHLEILFLRREREDWDVWSDERRAYWNEEREMLQDDGNATLNDLLTMSHEARRIRDEAHVVLNRVDGIIDQMYVHLDDLEERESDEADQQESEEIEDWDDEEDQREGEDDYEQDIPDANGISSIGSTPPSADHFARRSNAPSPSRSPLPEEDSIESSDHDLEHPISSPDQTSDFIQPLSQNSPEEGNLRSAERGTPTPTAPVQSSSPHQPQSPPRPTATQSLPPSQPSHRRRRSSEGDLPEAKRAREY